MRRIWYVLGLVGVLAAPAAAQEKKDDAFARAMIDPQLVLQHSQRINLTPAQRRTIMEELRAAQTDLGGLQANMMVAALEVQELLEAARIDEAATVAKTEEMLRIENQVKKRQLQFLIRVRNALDAQQLQLLKTIRDQGKPEDTGPTG